MKTARSVCYDILREILREARQFNPKEFRIVASAAVVEMLLDEESQHLAGLSDFIGKPISLQRRAVRRRRSSTTSCCCERSRRARLRGDDRFDRIIVICTRQIGDVLLTTPLIHAAKERWPEAAIDVLGFGGTLGMLRGNPDVAELIEVPAGSGWWRVAAPDRAPVAPLRPRADRAVLGPRPPLRLRRRAAARRPGHRRAPSRGGSGRCSSIGCG